MTQLRYRIVTDRAPETTRYEGPFGPMICRFVPELTVGWLPGLEITGKQVGWAAFRWEKPPVRSGVQSWQEELERGILAGAGDVSIGFSRRTTGPTRASRAIYVERPGTSRRMRMRCFSTYSLETPDGEPLVQEAGMRPEGVVSDPADVIDVVTMLLLTQSGLCTAVKQTLL